MKKYSKALRLFGALFMEKHDDVWVVSIGRISWWIAFIPALYIWLKYADRDISPNHLRILLTLAGYNFGKKVANIIKNIWGKNVDTE